MNLEHGERQRWVRGGNGFGKWKEQLQRTAHNERSDRRTGRSGGLATVPVSSSRKRGLEPNVPWRCDRQERPNRPRRSPSQPES